MCLFFGDLYKKQVMVGIGGVRLVVMLINGFGICYIHVLPNIINCITLYGFGTVKVNHILFLKHNTTLHPQIYTSMQQKNIAVVMNSSMGYRRLQRIK